MSEIYYPHYPSSVIELGIIPLMLITYPLYLIINMISKAGKEYKQYLGAEVSSQICKELGIKYTPKTKK